MAFRRCERQPGAGSQVSLHGYIDALRYSIRCCKESSPHGNPVSITFILDIQTAE